MIPYTMSFTKLFMCNHIALKSGMYNGYTEANVKCTKYVFMHAK